MKKPLCIVNYAVNGLGLGHLTRLVAISREVRRLCMLAGVQHEIFFLTSSEGDALCYANGFASFKIPSKNAVRATGLSPHRYKRTAKQWIWNAVNMCNPDLLVVDTFPGGAFDELYDVLDFGQRNVFIYRAVKSDVASSKRFQSLLGGYHGIVSIGEQGAHTSVIDTVLAERTHPVGEVMIRGRDELLSRSDARAMLGLQPESLAVYCTCGGGGDSNAEDILRTYVSVAAHFPDVEFVIGSGHLYHGREYHAPNVRWSQRMMMMECFAAFDAAVGAAGFNTVNELMHAGVPCVLLPQQRTYDDQFARAERIAATGAALFLRELTEENLTAALRSVIDNRTVMAEAARAAVPANAATDAAMAVLHDVINTRVVEHSHALRRSSAYPIAIALARTTRSSEHDALMLLRRMDALIRNEIASEPSGVPDFTPLDEERFHELFALLPHHLPLQSIIAALKHISQLDGAPRNAVELVESAVRLAEEHYT